MTDFIRESARIYRLEMHELNGPMKIGLEQVRLELNDFFGKVMDLI